MRQLLPAFLFILPLLAGADSSRERYDRAERLMPSEIGKFTHDFIDARWSADGATLFYSVESVAGARHFSVALGDGKITPLVEAHAHGKAESTGLGAFAHFLIRSVQGALPGWKIFQRFPF